MHLLAIMVQTFVILPLLIVVILSGNFGTNDFLVLLVSGGVQFFVFAHVYIVLHSDSIRELINTGKMVRQMQIMEMMILLQLVMIIYVITLSPLATKTIEGYYYGHIVYIALPIYAIAIVLSVISYFIVCKGERKIRS